MKLNLGCSDRVFGPEYLNVDCVPGEHVDQIADLTKAWPWANDSVKEVLLLDVAEHLPDKRHTLNELYRVLEDGGRATIETPNASKGAGAFQDPTHISYWTRNDFEYFEKGNFARERFRDSPYYGVKADFKIISMTESHYAVTRPDGSQWDDVWKFKVILEAVK